jgi:uncharacterized SAM-binding protein YcdF (DUF218 family)
MNFVTQKFFSALLLPIPLCILCALIAIILFTLHKKTCFRWGCVFSGASFAILLLFSLPILPTYLLSRLENHYSPITQVPQDIKRIVVLGAGNGGTKSGPPNDKLSAASLARLVEGIRLYKQIPDSSLILSGGRVFGSPPDSDTMNNVASLLGVSPKDVIIENGSQDTYHEALNLKKILGQAPFLLVTSAYHMPRAMALFEHQGMHPIAAPTEFLLAKKRYTIKRYFPNANYLVYSDIALHEYLGLIWSQYLGRI